MWKRIKNTDLFLNFTEDKLFITDFVTLWFSYLCKTTFVRSLKESNSLLEMSEDVLLQKGLQVLNQPSDVKSMEKTIDNKVLVVTMTMLFGYPFKVILRLCEGSKELFFQRVTQPLLKTVSELKSCQVELCQLLNKKDSEIDEYKTMGGEIAIKNTSTNAGKLAIFWRMGKSLCYMWTWPVDQPSPVLMRCGISMTPKFLKTKPFDETVLMKKYKMYQEYFGHSDDTVSSLINVKLDLPEVHSSIKNEIIAVSLPPKIKMEPDSQTPETETLPPVTLPEVKPEPEQSIKRESQSSISTNKKKIKKLNLASLTGAIRLVLNKHIPRNPPSLISGGNAA